MKQNSGKTDIFFNQAMGREQTLQILCGRLIQVCPAQADPAQPAEVAHQRFCVHADGIDEAGGQKDAVRRISTDDFDKVLRFKRAEGKHGIP